jgi:subtilase family serine protease
MGFAIFAALVVTVGAHVAQPAMTSHVPDAVVNGAARRVGAPSPAQPLELSISLPLRDESGLHALLDNIYDPASPQFRRYLSVADFAARFSPTPAAYQSLVAFAIANNLRPHGLAANRRVLDVRGAVTDVERAFHVKIDVYRHPTEARTFFAPDREPTLDLGTPVLHISGLDDYVLPVAHIVRASSAAAAAPPTGSGPDGNFIGSDIRAAYYGGSALIGTGQSVGLFEFPGYRLADVRKYFSKVGQPENVPIVGVSLNGASLDCNDKCDDGEQALDIEEAISMAPGLKQLIVYVGRNDVSIMNQMASDDTSKQLSCSWGFAPDAAAVDPIFEEFAAQGQSFLVATGDDGYHLSEGGVWPSDDQFVTAVGGTDLTTTGPGGAWLSETGWFYSGGGPSPDHIAIPAYQAPFIDAENDGSTKLRNVPDIAGDAQTDNYSCYDGGCYAYNGGTSYAAPLWAGYIALANQFAAASNKPPVGFLNPVIYTIGGSKGYPAAFHDQLHGYNGRYHARPGYDLVTGFGSPNGDDLIKALVRGR